MSCNCEAENLGRRVILLESVQTSGYRVSSRDACYLWGIETFEPQWCHPQAQIFDRVFGADAAREGLTASEEEIRAELDDMDRNLAEDLGEARETVEDLSPEEAETVLATAPWED